MVTALLEKVRRLITIVVVNVYSENTVRRLVEYVFIGSNITPQIGCIVSSSMPVRKRNNEGAPAISLYTNKYHK